MMNFSVNKNLLNFIIFAVSLFNFPTALAVENEQRSKSCRNTVFNHALTRSNQNANYTPGEYKQNNHRDLTNYFDSLGFFFRLSVERLARQGGVFIDVGAGYGIASIDLVKKYSNITAYSINVQDTWGLLKAVPNNDSTPHPMNYPENLQNPIYLELFTQLPHTWLNLYGKLGGDKDLLAKFYISITDTRFDTPIISPEAGFARIYIEFLNKKYTEAVSTDRLHFLTGYAEDELQHVNQQANLLTDIFGAYFYSIQRIQLLDEYYKKLAPGGEAYVIWKSTFGSLESSSAIAAKSTHQTKGQSLEEYLAEEYPQIFTLHQEIFSQKGYLLKHNYLKINKPENSPELNLSNKLKLVDHSLDEEEGNYNSIIETPNIIFRDK